MIKEFSARDRYNKKRGKRFLKNDTDFMIDAEKLFDIFCSDSKQRGKLKEHRLLRITKHDYNF